MGAADRQAVRWSHPGVPDRPDRRSCAPGIADAPADRSWGPSEGVVRGSPDGGDQTELPTLLIMLESVPPRKIRERIATMAMRTRMSPYSTSP